MEKSEMEAVRKEMGLRRYTVLLLAALHIGCVIAFWVLAHLWYEGDKRPIARLIVGAPAMENFYLEGLVTSLFKTSYNKQIGGNIIFLLHYAVFFWLIIWKPLRYRLLGLIVALSIQALLLGLSYQEISLMISANK